MKQVVLGPTFETRSGSSASDTGDALEAVLKGHADRLGYRRTGGHFLVSIRGERRHFWSPWLTLELTDATGADGEGSLGHGRFNPSPGIWTGFMLAALAMGTIATAGAVWAFAEWTLGRPAYGLSGAFVGVMGMGGLLIVSAFGQRLAKGEMDEIEAVVRGAVDTSGAVHGVQSSVGG